MTYEIVKRNYEHGLWTKTLVKMAFKKGIITEQQYEEIVGESVSE